MQSIALLKSSGNLVIQLVRISAHFSQCKKIRIYRFVLLIFLRDDKQVVWNKINYTEQKSTFF